MAYDYNYTYNDVRIGMDPHWAHITNDIYLKSYLSKWGHGTGSLAKDILSRYKTHYGYVLDISEDSLVVEILAHYYCDGILKLGSAAFVTAGLPGAAAALLIQGVRALASSHLTVIDCGESSVDGNRHIWDELQSFRGIIEAVLVD